MASLTDRDVLVGRAYADAGPLEARQAVYRWQQPPVDLPGRALSWLRGADGLVVDVGCGNGRYLRRMAADRPDLRVLGLDLSPGMRPLMIADAQRLPLPDAIAGAVLAMHMLYHVPDIDRAAGEMARVLRPDGVAIAAANGGGHMREFGALFARAVQAVRPGATAGGGPSVGHRFRLESGPAVLERHFASVRADSWESRVAIPEPGPAIAYLDSTRASREGLLPPGVSWDAMLSAAQDLVTGVIERDGEFGVTARSGLLICRRPHAGRAGAQRRPAPDRRG
jgi:SAM-dependent methyltransferase